MAGAGTGSSGIAAGRPACGILLRASRVHLFLHLIVHLALPPIRNPHRISNFPLSVPQIVILCRLVFRYIYIRHNNYGRKKEVKLKEMQLGYRASRDVQLLLSY
jgi:hypothetical protein